MAAALVVSGCAHHAHAYAGMTRAEARRQAVGVARTMQNVEALTNDFASGMTAAPVGTFESRNTAHGEAWLTVFRLFKHQVNDPDEACIWAWREDNEPHFEEVQSVAYGRVPDALHDRCTRFVFAHGFASRDQVAGDATPPPIFARPVPQTPFGPLPPGTYLTEILPSDAFFLVGPSVEAPTRSAPGTCGFAGRVENAAGTRFVPFARVSVLPSRPWSGISDGGAWAWPNDAVVTTADSWGTFVFTNLPFTASGFDISIRALGYAPARTIHQTCDVIGEWIVGRRPIFEDATPVARG